MADYETSFEELPVGERLTYTNSIFDAFDWETGIDTWPLENINAVITDEHAHAGTRSVTSIAPVSGPGEFAEMQVPFTRGPVVDQDETLFFWHRYDVGSSAASPTWFYDMWTSTVGAATSYDGYESNAISIGWLGATTYEVVFWHPSETIDVEIPAGAWVRVDVAYRAVDHAFTVKLSDGAQQTFGEWTRVMGSIGTFGWHSLYVTNNSFRGKNFIDDINSEAVPVITARPDMTRRRFS